MVRASIASYLCQQRASMTLATTVISDPPADDFIVLEGVGQLYVLPCQFECLDREIRRAAMENVQPHRIPGVFPWK